MPYFRGLPNSAPPHRQGSPTTMATRQTNSAATTAYEIELWAMADALRGSLDAVQRHGHVLTPGRYVGVESKEDDGEPFDETMKRLAAELREQQAEGARLDAEIRTNLERLRVWGGSA